jgi:hypothetical protein
VRKKSQYALYCKSACCRAIVRHVHAHFLEDKQTQRHSFGLNKVTQRVVVATGVTQGKEFKVRNQQS